MELETWRSFRFGAGFVASCSRPRAYSKISPPARSCAVCRAILWFTSATIRAMSGAHRLCSHSERDPSMECRRTERGSRPSGSGIKRFSSRSILVLSLIFTVFFLKRIFAKGRTLCRSKPYVDLALQSSPVISVLRIVIRRAHDGAYWAELVLRPPRVLPPAFRSLQLRRLLLHIQRRTRPPGA